MRILAICQFYHPENFTITPLLNQLVRLGHDVTVVTGRPNAGFGRILPEYRRVRFEIIDGVKVHRVPIVARKNGRLSLIANYFSFYLSARMFVARHQQDYDVVFGMSLSPVISLVPAVAFARRKRLPLLVYCVDLWPESVAFTDYVRPDSLAYRILKRWSGDIYRAADRLLLGSPSYRQYMQEVHHIDEPRLRTLLQPALTETLKSAPHVFSRGIHLVYVGNLGTVQLLDEFIEAAAEFKNDELNLHIIGSGSALERLRRRAAELGVSDKVMWYGTLPSPEAFAYMASADALFVPLKEGGYVGQTIPNKLMMALAAGRPILGALKGDGRALLEYAGGGIIVEPSKDGIIAGIRRLLHMGADEKKALGERNRTYFQDHLTLEKIGCELETHFIDLTN